MSHKTTNAEKLAAGTYRPSNHQPEPHSTLTTTPEPPARFNETERAIWFDVIHSMQLNNTLHADLLPLIQQYCTFSTLAEFWSASADRETKKENSTLANYGKLNQLARLNSQAAGKLASQLGLNPAVRKPAPLPRVKSILDKFLE